MQSHSEILASNPTLSSYRVMLHEDKGDKFQIAFDCYAEDSEHAAEQAENAYPNGEVLTITPFDPKDGLTTLPTKNEGDMSKTHKTMAEVFAILNDYVERSTHWREGGADRHAAKLALKDFGAMLDVASSIRETGSAPVAQELSEGIKIGRQARAMYAKSPTYKGTTPMTWDEAPLAARRYWIEKAKEQPATVQEQKAHMQTELEKDASKLLFALHDAWPYVHKSCTIESTRNTIAGLMRKHGEFADLHPKEEGPGNRVLVVVSGGVADPVCDAGVDVEVFDWDNYNADPEGTGGVPSHFADLAEGLGIPVSEVPMPVNRPRP